MAKMMMMRFVVLYLVLAVALCSVLVVLFKTDAVSISDCRVGYGCIRTETASSSSSTEEIRSRKLLLHNNAEEVFKSFGPLDQHKQRQDGGNVDGWSLRTVPSGPDPLHHNGSGPKKPQTP